MNGIMQLINRIDESSVNTLARSYNVLDYHRNLRVVLSSILPQIDFAKYSKYQLHETINYILTSYFKGESRLKAKLVEMFVERNVTSAFEIRVNNSRVDFLSVNGDTQSYEIKSGIDNLDKLSKQISDYEKVFEYNYLVIDEKHFEKALDLIPSHYGIYILKNDRIVRKKIADKNCCLKSEMQLQLFTKKELGQYFKETDSSLIICNFSDDKINEVFKLMLKKRYEKRWRFLKDNRGEILPIDYQFFFHHNIAPKVIYGD